MAGADGKVEPQEMDAFVKAMAECQDPVLRAILASGEGDPAEQVQRLFDDDTLAPRALAAAGAIFAEARGGAAARTAFLDILRRVAGAHGGELREPERRALEGVEAALGAGVGVALSGPDPYDGASPRRVELMEHAALAPFAMFMAVAAADGQLDQAEVRSFVAAMQAMKDPLLAEILSASPLAFPDRLTRLAEDTGDLAERSLFAMGVLLAEEPGGEAAREALMALLTPVAAGREAEQKVLEGLAGALRTAGEVARSAGPSGGRGGGGALLVVGAVVVVVVSIALWAFS